MGFWRDGNARTRAAAVPLAAAAALVMTGGCNMEEATVPNIVGPSSFALSLVLSASPDVVKADGSTAVIVAMLRGPDGQGIGGRTIVFTRSDASGQEAAIGTLSAERVTTGSDGRARVIYTAPDEMHFHAHQSVHVQGRVVGEDFSSGNYHSVQIEVIPVVIRRFPEDGDNDPPLCGFNTVPRFNYFYVGVPIWFQSTGYSPNGYIVRYEWRWGDGGTDFVPDVFHTYWLAGSYYASHTVMDNYGFIESCDQRMVIVEAP